MGWFAFSPTEKVLALKGASSYCPSTPYLSLLFLSTSSTTQNKIKNKSTKGWNWSALPDQQHSHHSAILERLRLCPFSPSTGTWQTNKQRRISSYMLLFFRGELTEPFLCWLREPPMATAKSVFCFPLISDALYVLLSASQVHLCLSSRQPDSTSELHNNALLLMTGLLSCRQAASPLLVFSLSLVTAVQSKCSGVLLITHE